MLATIAHRTGRPAAMARLRAVRPATFHAPRALAPDAAAGESADPLLALCACGHTHRAHVVPFSYDRQCRVVGCACQQFSPRASASATRAAAVVIRGSWRSPTPPAQTVPAGTRGEVLGLLVDIEDAIEAGDRPRAREGLAHLRQALDQVPF